MSAMYLSRKEKFGFIEYFREKWGKSLRLKVLQKAEFARDLTEDQQRLYRPRMKKKESNLFPKLTAHLMLYLGQVGHSTVLDQPLGVSVEHYAAGNLIGIKHFVISELSMK
ncbi:hypothetical protein LOTGIDRAFT_173717 [Lottia gigantea]|uniref:Uncharacterized protein n=1 Tax=Lottia gigantea TaxID=225164 RepID=V4AWZ0_LOTGI|nr:hypothetical protein LOTGIDRAFT_173717 [Lottia gigantea]ESO99575.1 hypothetical protein LOTGIDRAFT_173717 [Lottia gigantea]